MQLKALALIGTVSILLTACLEPVGSAHQKKTSLTSERDRYSYALGAHFANQAYAQLVARDSLDIDLDVFEQAFRERFAQDSANYLMNDSVVFETLNELSRKSQEERLKKDSIAAEKSKAEQDAFLEKNKTEEGVIVTESGLQYKVLKEGSGESPNDSSMVSVHYTGTLLDGKKFDSSYDREKPMEFPVKAVIPGWVEMLKLMKPGEKVKAWIPSELGYGKRTMRDIPANSLLVFEMELLEVKAGPDFDKK